MKKFDASVFTADILTDFLDWLENSRNCGINTRNQRLAAMKAFSNYAIRSCPENCKNYQDMLRIKIKKSPQTMVDYLSVDAIILLMSKPDTSTREGVRDLAARHFCFMRLRLEREPVQLDTKGYCTIR